MDLSDCSTFLYSGDSSRVFPNIILFFVHLYARHGAVRAMESGELRFNHRLDGVISGFDLVLQRPSCGTLGNFLTSLRLCLTMCKTKLNKSSSTLSIHIF